MVRQHRQDRSADAARGDHRARSTTPASPARRSTSPAPAAATTSPARRSRSCRTSTPSGRGRRSATRTSRWTARGRCTKRGCGCRSATSTSRVAMGSGRSSTADPALIYPMEMDPYYLAPLGTDAASFAALQARALIDAGKVTERQMAEVSSPVPTGRAGQPERAGHRRLRRRRLARRRLRALTVAPARPAADHRRRVSVVVIARADTPGSCATTRVHHRLRSLHGGALPGHA